MLYRYFFPFTHHKRNIFHFLIVAFPLGGPPARTSGHQSHRGHLMGSKLGSTLTQRETQRLEDFDPTGEAPGAKATGILTRFQVTFHVDPAGDTCSRTSTQQGKLRAGPPVQPNGKATMSQ